MRINKNDQVAMMDSSTIDFYDILLPYGLVIDEDDALKRTSPQTAIPLTLWKLVKCVTGPNKFKIRSRNRHAAFGMITERNIDKYIAQFVPVENKANISKI